MHEPMGAAKPNDEGGMGCQLPQNSAVLPGKPMRIGAPHFDWERCTLIRADAACRANLPPTYSSSLRTLKLSIPHKQF
jgi:hypothetical protein